MLKHTDSSSLQLSKVTFDNKYHEMITECKVLKTSMYVSSFVYEIYCIRSKDRSRIELEESVDVLNTCQSILYENLDIVGKIANATNFDKEIMESLENCKTIMLSHFTTWESFIYHTMFKGIHSDLTKKYFLQFYNLVTCDFC